MYRPPLLSRVSGRVLQRVRTLFLQNAAGAGSTTVQLALLGSQLPPAPNRIGRQASCGAATVSAWTANPLHPLHSACPVSPQASCAATTASAWTARTTRAARRERRSSRRRCAWLPLCVCSGFVWSGASSRRKCAWLPHVCVFGFIYGDAQLAAGAHPRSCVSCVCRWVGVACACVFCDPFERHSSRYRGALLPLCVCSTGLSCSYGPCTFFACTLLLWLSMSGQARSSIPRCLFPVCNVTPPTAGRAGAGVAHEPAARRPGRHLSHCSHRPAAAAAR